MGTERVRQSLRTAKSIDVLANADLHAPKMFHRVFDTLATIIASLVIGPYIPVIVNSEGRKMNYGWILWALETTFPIKVLLFFRTIYAYIKLRIEKMLIEIKRYKQQSSIAFLVQRVTKTRTAVREQKNLKSRQSFVHPYLYNGWNLERFLVLAFEADGYSFCE